MSQKNLIETDSVQSAKDIQQKFHYLLNSALFQDELEALFNGVAGGKDWVYFDKIELNLGNLSPTISVETLKKQVLAEMTKSISETGVTHFSETKKEEKLKSNNQTKVEKTLFISKLEEAWIVFITQQTLPQNFHFEVRSLKHFVEVSEEILKKEKTTFHVWFLSLMRRISEQNLENLPLRFWSELLKKQIKLNRKQLAQLTKVINEVKSQDSRKGAKTAIIHFLVSNTSSKTTEEAILLLQELQEISSVNQNKSLAQRQKRRVVLERDTNEKHNKKEEQTDLWKKEEEYKNPFVNNAGMALVFPFLPEVFKQLKFTNKDKLTEPDRALHFLSFVERGEEVFAPHHNLLYKIVCGLPENYLTNAEINLTKSEKKEAKDLLVSVIEHWGALKNSTPAGLRDAFLQREGKLVKTGFDYHLKVEQKAQDVLLSRIPWGFGVIRLPWMTNFLHVDW